MCWGALTTGARAATGSTGQGLSLMQESFAEAALARLPMVIFNLSRGQSDYFQATRGGGHGDYRHVVLAPMDVVEAVELTQLAFHLADKWRNPVLVYGDFLIAHTYAAVDIEPLVFEPLAPKDWGLDGTTSGTGRAKMISSIGIGKLHDMGPGIEAHFQAVGPHTEEIAAVEQRHDAGFLDDAEHVVVAFGSAGKFVRNVVAELRAGGVRIGYVRPITLWPFPYEAVRAAAEGVQSVMVFENSAGQLIDDVKIAVEGAAPVVGIGGVSTDSSGFGVGDLYDVDVIRARVLAQIESRGDAAEAWPDGRDAGVESTKETGAKR
jgi:2-oxoglutarate ferredoxin oxidoreductase subunit alpha